MAALCDGGQEPYTGKYGNPKYKLTRVENASIENASAKLHGWNTQVRKTQVQTLKSGEVENVSTDTDRS